jgi:hypothetical protein
MAWKLFFLLHALMVCFHSYSQAQASHYFIEVGAGASMPKAMARNFSEDAIDETIKSYQANSPFCYCQKDLLAR